jgi:hypothetical protein
VSDAICTLTLSAPRVASPITNPVNVTVNADPPIIDAP